MLDISVAHDLWQLLPLQSGLVRPYSFLGGECPFTGYVRSPLELTRIRVPQGVNVYIQLNAATLGWGYRPSAQHVPAIQGILVDLDPLEYRTTIADVEYMRGVLLELGVCTWQLVLIYSGRGFQFWILLDNAPAELAKRIPTFLHGLPKMESCRVDTSCCDLPRLARMPGTVNRRTGDVARIVGCSQKEPGPWEWLGQFEPIAPPPQIEPCPIESFEWQAYFSYLTGAARKYILEGCEEGRRHQQAFATAASLRDAGAPLVAAKSALLLGNSLCWRPLRQEDILHALSVAYRKGKDHENTAH